MKNLLFLPVFTLIVNTTLAQQCTDENVTSLPGKWLSAMKGASDHSAADMGKEKAILDGIAEIIRSNFNWHPIGGDITTGNAYSIRGLDYRPTPVRKIANTYSNFIFFQHYFCNHGQINREDFFNRLTVLINEIPFEFSKTFFISKVDQYGNPLQQDPETDKYGYLKDIPVVTNGYFTYVKYHPVSRGDAENHYLDNNRILVKDGQLPFKLMPKKEYYEKWKLQHLNSIQQAAITRDKMAVLAKTSGDNRDVQFYQSEIDQYQGYINIIDRQLSSRSTQELAQPALSGEERGAYLDNNDPKNRHDYIIVPNLAYYNAGVPKSTPQIIWIKFDYEFKRVHSGVKQYADEDFVAELERIKIVDLLTEKLKPLLK